MTYLESHLFSQPIDNPVVGYIKRPDGRILSSEMLGMMEATPRPYCTLGNFLDVALATLAADNAVSLIFPEVPHD